MTGEARRGVCLFVQAPSLYQDAKVCTKSSQADIATFSWIGLLQKFGLDLFLLHIRHCFPVAFLVCLFVCYVFCNSAGHIVITC